MSFLSNYGLNKIGRLGDAITNLVATSDPDVAAEVDIDTARKHCHELATKVASCMSKFDKDAAMVKELTTKLSSIMQASGVIAARMETNPADSSLNIKLTRLMDEANVIGGSEGDGSVSGTLFVATQNMKTSESDLQEWTQIHSHAVAELSTMEETLAHAKRDMENAQEQERRAREREAEAERDAGLRKGSGASVAVNAMKLEAEKAKERAAAATINTNSLKAVTGSSTDDILKEVLSEPVAHLSALERFKQITKQ